MKDDKIKKKIEEFDEYKEMINSDDKRLKYFTIIFIFSFVLGLFGFLYLITQFIFCIID
jgi:hypothetical protein